MDLKWVAASGSRRRGSLVARSTDQDGSHSRKRHGNTAWAWAEATASRGGSLCLTSLSLISLSRLSALKSHFPFFSFLFSFFFFLRFVTFSVWFGFGRLRVEVCFFFKIYMGHGLAG